LGLTNPALAGEACNGGGRLTEDVRGVVVAAAFALGVSTFSGCLDARSGVLAGSLCVDVSAGLFGVLFTVGDFAGFAATLLAEGTESGFGVVLVGALVLGFGPSCFPFAFSLPLPLPTPFACCATGFDADRASEWTGFSVAVPGAWLLSLRGEPVEASAAGPFVILGGEARPGASESGNRGDSGMGWLWRLFVAVSCAIASAKIFLFSCLGAGVVLSVASLGFRVAEMLESWLVPRCRPILPSFSMATKSARTLDRGRGDSLPGGMPGERPRSGGLVSPFCSNMARRFLTALMVAAWENNGPAAGEDAVANGGSVGKSEAAIIGVVVRLKRGAQVGSDTLMPKF